MLDGMFAGRARACNAWTRSDERASSVHTLGAPSGPLPVPLSPRAARGHSIESTRRNASNGIFDPGTLHLIPHDFRTGLPTMVERQCLSSSGDEALLHCEPSIVAHLASVTCCETDGYPTSRA